MLNNFWEKAKGKGKLSFRMYKGLYSSAEAQAKLHLKDVMDSKFAEQAMESVQLMMVQYGETVKIMTNPRELTLSKCLEILRQTQRGITVRSLIEMAKKADPQINEYIGRNLSMNGNFKVRTVVDLLGEQRNVKEVCSNPLILKWIDDEESVQKNGLSDVSDASDAIIKMNDVGNKSVVDSPKTKKGSDTSEASDRNSNSESDVISNAPDAESLKNLTESKPPSRPNME